MRKYLVATSVAALAVSLAACGSGSSSSAPGGTSDGSLSLGQIQPPTTFVPGGFGSGPTAQSLKTVPVGSGPYTLDQGATQAGYKYVYTLNANYWNKKAFPYDKLTITVFSDSNAILNALQSKQLDGSVVGPKDIAAVKGAGMQV